MKKSVPIMFGLYHDRDAVMLNNKILPPVYASTAVVLFTAAMERRFIRFEEESMEESFGEEYRLYKSKVRRWI
jgi:protein-S-isoprenylcysteine O-methyltransferase Ste14